MEVGLLMVIKIPCLERHLTTYIDEAFKNSLWPTATWHYYSKWLILPRLGKHLQVHSDACSGSGSDYVCIEDQHFLCELGQIAYSSVLWDPGTILIRKI